MLEWVKLADGIWSCKISKSFLTLYVIKALDTKYWPQVNGRQVKQGYSTLELAQKVVEEAARRLLQDALKGLKDN